ncbi:KilA-N domain-containing protein [Kiloniella majae]|uniref:KilA-N domain-containing protein n=1 Tax=Kiloniella majae TaxID=1938558 RepID=UPI000A2771C7|nr:KilA-N domain-containing protein [Kiloniella majae]
MLNLVPTPKNNNPIIIDGQELPCDEYGRVHLNSLHKLSGAGGHKRPYEWLRLIATQQLLEEYSQNDDTRSGVSTQNGGSNSGTYANELLAVSYAGWISPAFQLKVNAVFLAVRNGEIQSAIPQTRAEILRLALEVEEKNEQLTAENKQ